MSSTAAVFDPIDSRVPAFRTLDITPNEGGPDTLRTALTASLAAPWHDPQEADRSGADWLWFKLGREDDDGLPAATVLLHRVGPIDGDAGATLRLTAVVPRAGAGDIGPDLHNAIVEDFHHVVVRPLVEAGSVVAHLSEPSCPLEDWVGEDGVEELARFLHAPSANAGLSHPADADRWYRFLNAALPARREGFPEAVEQVLLRHGLAPVTVEPLVLAAERIEHYERAARERRRERVEAA